MNVSVVTPTGGSVVKVYFTQRRLHSELTQAGSFTHWTVPYVPRVRFCGVTSAAQFKPPSGALSFASTLIAVIAPTVLQTSPVSGWQTGAAGQ